MRSAVTRALLNALATLLIVVGLWQAVVSFAGVSPYVAKGPADVWRYLVLDDVAAGGVAEEHRRMLLDLTGTTLADAGWGFGIGLLLASALAVAFSLSRVVEAGVMPLALLLRSVPLVAIAPVILLLTGRGTTLSVVVIGSIVVLFPALAAVLFGLSRASSESLDLVHVFGGGNLAALAKVAIPGALPALFAAARVSVPGAVTGALLAEWLSTGKGVGGNIVTFSAAARFDELWASVALVTLVTLALYNAVATMEKVVLVRMGVAPAPL